MTTTTAATRLKRRNYGRGHGYLLDGEKITGVTTAIDVLDKPALRQWYANEAAKRVLDDWDKLLEMSPSARFDYVKFGAKDRVQAAALRGTEIHKLGDKVARGEKVEVPGEYRGPVEAYARFLDRWEIETIASETPLCHTQHRYGGTADLWAVIGKLGIRALLDVKTGKGVYDETGLQLSGYRFADLVQVDGEEIIGANGAPAIETEAAFIAHVGPDDVRLVPAIADESTFRSFLYVLHVHQTRKGWEDWPLIGSAIQPGEDWR